MIPKGEVSISNLWALLLDLGSIFSCLILEKLLNFSEPINWGVIPAL